MPPFTLWWKVGRAGKESLARWKERAGRPWPHVSTLQSPRTTASPAPVSQPPRALLPSPSRSVPCSRLPAAAPCSPPRALLAQVCSPSPLLWFGALVSSPLWFSVSHKCPPLCWFVVQILNSKHSNCSSINLPFYRSIQRKGIGSHVRELNNLSLFDSINFMQRRKVKARRTKMQTLL